jgi:hypothetical protein
VTRVGIKPTATVYFLAVAKEKGRYHAIYRVRIGPPHSRYSVYTSGTGRLLNEFGTFKTVTSRRAAWGLLDFRRTVSPPPAPLQLPVQFYVRLYPDNVLSCTTVSYSVIKGLQLNLLDRWRLALRTALALGAFGYPREMRPSSEEGLQA